MLYEIIGAEVKRQFIVKIYVNLVSSWAVFYVCYN